MLTVHGCVPRVVVRVIARCVLACGVAMGVGCGGSGPTAPAAAELVAPASGPVTAGTLYPRGPIVREGQRANEARPGDAAIAVRVERREAGSGFVEVFSAAGRDGLEPQRTNRFERRGDGSVVLVSTENHERGSTVAYEPPLLAMPAAGLAPGDAVVSESEARTEGFGGGGSARLTTVYAGDERIEWDGASATAQRIESEFVLTVGRGGKLERSLVRWLVDGQVVRERTHEVISAGPFRARDRRTVDEWAQ